MRKRRVAAIAAVALSAGSLIPAATAHADTVTTLYVNNTVACSDAGSGTQADPYCTIQAAANVVDPGQTVLISGTFNNEVDITRSGTAGAPITFESATYRDYIPSATINGLDTAAHGFTITGASYVDINQVKVTEVADHGIVVSGSSNVAISQVMVNGVRGTSAAGVLVTGNSNAVTVEQSEISGYASGVEVDSGVTGAIVTTNELSSAGGPAVEVLGASGTDVTSNSVSMSCSPDVEVTGTAANTSIENNVLPGGPGPYCTTPLQYDLAVDASATATTTVDYNIVGHAQLKYDYDWGSTPYTVPADFTTATGQAAHDLDVNYFTNPSSSATIDSANSDAPGELSVDIDGFPRVDDPLIPNTGGGSKPYYDRGVSEAEDPSITIGTSSVSATQAPTGGVITATTNATDAWHAALVYTFDFGDGTTEQSTGNTATHAYATPGTYKITCSISYGQTLASGIAVGTVNVVPPAPLTPALAVSASGAMTVTADSTGSTDAWKILSSTFDFGDGTAPVTVSGTQGVSHTYTAPGKYAVKVTEADAGGASATSTPTASTLAVSVAGQAVAGTGLTVTASGSTATGSLPTNGVQLSFGDGTTQPLSSGGLQHTYATPGTYTLSVTAADQGGNVVIGTHPVTTAGSDYTPDGPLRILDTRIALGAPKAKLAAGTVLRLKVAGANGIPANATAVAVNLTLTDATGAGDVDAYPDGASVPTTSNLNYVSGQVVANMAIVPIGNGGYIDLVKHGLGSVDLVADVAGYYTAAAANGFDSVAPTRILDTRIGLGAPQAKLGPGSVIRLKVANVANVPSYARAVAINLTLTHTSGGGYIVAYPEGGATPKASNLNYSGSMTVANMAVVPIGSDGYIDIAKGGSGTVDLVGDVSAYFSAGYGASAYVPITPFRYFDTRTSGQKLPGSYYLAVPFIVNSDGTLDTAITGFVLNTTVTNTTAGGYLSVFPDNGTGAGGGAVPPTISNLNFNAGQTVPNLVFAQPSLADGYIDFFNGSAGKLDVLADVFGFYTTS